MYASKVDNQVLNFGVSGMLWRRSLVMYDKETESHWSHILGEAMEGKLLGKKLEVIPSVMTDWKTWSEKHPESKVLWMRRTSRRFKNKYYRDLHAFVLGIVHQSSPKAWKFAGLAEQPIVNDRYAAKSVVVTYDPQNFTARLFSRNVDGTDLSFKGDQSGKMTDDQSGSEWDRMTGQCLSGKYKGRYLKSLPAISSFTTSWLRFHPESAVWPID